MDDLLAASEDELSEVEDVGAVIAESVYKFLHSEHGELAVRSLRDAGLDMTAPKKQPVSSGTAGPLSGKTLVVTGTLENYSREEIESLIEQHGGRAAKSISKKTDYLIAGEKAGSKLEKARSLGVAILTESEFMALVGP
jgi:DNA ligase (NAD+)